MAPKKDAAPKERELDALDYALRGSLFFWLVAAFLMPFTPAMGFGVAGTGYGLGAFGKKEKS